MITIKRTQFPVGHGGFHYGEINFDKDRKFTWIFDCGTDNSQDLIESHIESISNEIDIFYLSHFHSDHYSGINKLIQHGIKIKNFVIPYTEILDRFFYAITDPSHVGNSINSINTNLLHSPKTFLSQSFNIRESSVIEIGNPEIQESISESQEYNFGPYTVFFDAKSGNAEIIYNQEKLPIWEILTHTSPKIANNSQSFFNYIIQECKKNGLLNINSKITAKQVENLLNRKIVWEYIFSKINLKSQKIFQCIKDAYTGKISKVFPDGTNGCCISIYSGISSYLFQNKLSDFSAFWPPVFCCSYDTNKNIITNHQYPSYWNFRDGWVLTGDMPLNDMNYLYSLASRFSPNERVSLFSAPHHGSDKSWNQYILNIFSNIQLLTTESKPGHKHKIGWIHPGFNVQLDCSNSKSQMYNITDKIGSKLIMHTFIRI